jgi:cobyrinic acid a,c-diamide synthase
MIARLADAVSAGVDLDRIIDLASAAGLPAGKTGPVASPQQQTADVRVAIARDAAFGFYYPDDLAFAFIPWPQQEK